MEACTEKRKFWFENVFIEATFYLDPALSFIIHQNISCPQA